MSNAKLLASDDLELALELHRAAWPASREGLVELLASTVADLLDGAVWSVTREPEADRDDPGHLDIPGLTAADAALIRRALPPPELSYTNIPRWAPCAGRLVNPDVDSVGVDELAFYRLVPTPAVALARGLVSPVFQKLMGCWRLRTEAGPKTLKGRLRVIESAVTAHEILGLDTQPTLLLLDPELDAHGLANVRLQIRGSWKDRPADFCDRVSYLLARDSAEQAAKKMKKDGSVAEADVLTARLSSTALALFGDWEAIADYLDLQNTRSRAFIPPITPPPGLPSALEERSRSQMSWWLFADDLLANQSYLDSRLFRLQAWGAHPSARSDFVLRALPELPEVFSGSDDVQRLWGLRSDRRDPALLVTNRAPVADMINALGEPYRFWLGVANLVFSLTHGGSRCDLDGVEELFQREVEVLAQAGVPVNAALWSDLLAAGISAIDEMRAIRGHQIPLFDRDFAESLKRDGVDPEIVSAFEEAAEELDRMKAEMLLKLSGAFDAMRDVAARHRRAWVAEHWDSWIEYQWRSEATLASTAYAEATEDRGGKSPTAKGAWPLLGPLANKWFGGDCSALANALDIEGPIATPPTRSPRELPADLDSLMYEVIRHLDGDPESADWFKRRRGELGCRVPEALEHWQITGKAPTRSGLRIPHILTDIDADPNCSFDAFVSALGTELSKTSHPAAEAFIAPLSK